MLRPAGQHRKLEQLFGDLDRLHILLKGRKSISVYVDKDKSHTININNDERDKVCYNLLRKAIQDSISNLEEEVRKLGFEYSVNDGTDVLN